MHFCKWHSRVKYSQGSSIYYQIGKADMLKRNLFLVILLPLDFRRQNFVLFFLHDKQFQSTIQSSHSVNVERFTDEYRLSKISHYKLFLV